MRHAHSRMCRASRVVSFRLASRQLSTLCPEQLQEWCAAVLATVPAAVASEPEKAEFLRRIGERPSQDAFYDAVLSASSR